MQKTKLWTVLACTLSVATLVASAQSSRKPGLWEATTTMTFQQSPMPPGMQAPPGSPFSGAPRITQVCVTQAMIDKYGGPLPQNRGQCQVSNVNITPTGMSAALTCTGQASGAGTVETTFTDANSVHSKVHFTGTLQMGPQSRPIEWTSDTTSAYKGPECGSVQPITIPSDK
jgi:hypothetical protein